MATSTAPELTTLQLPRITINITQNIRFIFWHFDRSGLRQNWIDTNSRFTIHYFLFHFWNTNRMISIHLVIIQINFMWFTYIQILVTKHHTFRMWHAWFALISTRQFEVDRLAVRWCAYQIAFFRKIVTFLRYFFISIWNSMKRKRF